MAYTADYVSKLEMTIGKPQERYTIQKQKNAVNGLKRRAKMICDNCTHSDGKYCICGIIEEGDIEISKIWRMVERIADEYGGIVDWDDDHCPYYEEDDMDGYNEDMAWESEHNK